MSSPRLLQVEEKYVVEYCWHYKVIGEALVTLLEPPEQKKPALIVKT